MIIAFWGDELYIYDKDLRQKIAEVLEHLFSLKNNIYFFITDQAHLISSLQPIFTDIVLGLLQEYRLCENVRIIRAQTWAGDKNISLYDRTVIECDRVICPIKSSIKYNFVTDYQLHQWLGYHATCILTYYYDLLDPIEMRRLQKFAEQGAKITNLADPATRSIITKKIGKLPGREQFVLNQLHAGQKYMELARKMYLSNSGVRNIATHAITTIKRAMIINPE